MFAQQHKRAKIGTPEAATSIESVSKKDMEKDIKNIFSSTSKMNDPDLAKVFKKKKESKKKLNKLKADLDDEADTNEESKETLEHKVKNKKKAIHFEQVVKEVKKEKRAAKVAKAIKETSKSATKKTKLEDEEEVIKPAAKKTPVPEAEQAKHCTTLSEKTDEDGSTTYTIKCVNPNNKKSDKKRFKSAHGKAHKKSMT
jgi:hypothetical protein